jgi:hypothetical protein
MRYTENPSGALIGFSQRRHPSKCKRSGHNGHDQVCAENALKPVAGTREIAV